MGKSLVDLIYCKLGKKKVSENTRGDDENLTDDKFKKVVTIEKEIEGEVLHKIKEIKNEFDYLIDSIIRKHINDIINKLMKENEEITEEQVLNAVGWFVNSAYKDMIKEMKDWVIKNNKELITNISKIIKEHMQISINENSDLKNNEINKAMDKCMPLYSMQIKELNNDQIKLLKEKIDNSIGGQLVISNKEFKNNNIKIVVLEKKLKKYTNEIMLNFAVKNKKQYNIILENISQEFKKLKEDLSYRKINKEAEKTLDDFKAIYDNPLQKSVDETLKIAKALNK